MNKFKGKKVLIMGLGLHGGGVGSATFFYKKGAKVLVTDLKKEEELKESLKKLKKFKIKYVLGKHRKEDFLNSDLIIKNPAIPSNSPFLEFARNKNIPIKDDISIFFDLCRAKIIGITGTKGKTTVSNLIFHGLKEEKKKIFLAGNVGVSSLNILDKIKKDSLVVLELSSFELEEIKKSPKISVFTNIYRDHLNRYKGMKEYINAKKNIFKYQKKTDFLILNYDNKETRTLLKEAISKTIFFSFKNEKTDCFIKNENIFFKKQLIFNINELKIFGKHNLLNVLAAVSVLKLLKIKNEKIKRAFKKFKGVPHRQEFIVEKGGVKYFNDTAATMPDATIAAINIFKKRFPKSNIILIAGGEDKNLKFKNLARAIEKNISSLVLLPGTASNKLKRELKKKILEADSMKTAVKKSSNIAKRGDLIILSPGAASFNLFKNEFDRGDKFKKEIKNI